MATGCEPTSVRFTRLLISSTAGVELVNHQHCFAMLLIFGRLDRCSVGSNNLSRGMQGIVLGSLGCL